MIKEAPIEVQNLIKEYMTLNFNEKEVCTPYYRNVKRVRAELRSLVGKGTPAEIAEETLIYAKLRGFSLSQSTPDQIREFMQSQGIGVDCSGFVAHTLNIWSKSIGKGNLSSHIKLPHTSLYRKLVNKLRFFENAGANTLTNTENCVKVSLKDMRPGDLIRLKGLSAGHHIAVIIETVSDTENNLTSFKYAHSSEQYGDQNGVRHGEVKILNVNNELKDQEWLETDENGECWTLKQLMKEYHDNGLRRPNFLNN